MKQERGNGLAKTSARAHSNLNTNFYLHQLKTSEFGEQDTREFFQNQGVTSANLGNQTGRDVVDRPRLSTTYGGDH